MKIKQHPLISQFQCTGADCPANCCRGWKIPIDDGTYEKYIAEKGFLGFLLRCFLVKKEDIASFRSGRHRYRCPFWGLDNLCTLQKRYGIGYMPLVCVQFPRQLSNFGSFCEETLYLACPEAARLFICRVRAKLPFCFEETAGNADYAVTVTNDDLDFLNYLLQARTELIAMLESGCGLDACLLRYAKDAQDKCLSYGALNTGMNLGSKHFALPSPLAYQTAGQTPFTVDASGMYTLFFKGFYHPSLKYSSPVLYKLCQKYIRAFYPLTNKNPKAADAKLQSLMESVYEYVPDFDALMTYYYIYFLQKNFLDIFEDYSFLKHMLCGFAQARMLQLFIALCCAGRRGKKKRSLSTEELSLIIGVYERRAPQIEDALKYLTDSITPLFLPG